MPRNKDVQEDIGSRKIDNQERFGSFLKILEDMNIPHDVCLPNGGDVPTVKVTIKTPDEERNNGNDI